MGREGEAFTDRPGSESGAKTWDGFSRNLGAPVFDVLQIADGAAAQAGPGLRGGSPPHRSERGEQKRERGSKFISNRVFGAGSLSALIVPMTSGNAVQADPAEGSGAPLLQNRS